MAYTPPPSNPRGASSRTLKRTVLQTTAASAPASLPAWRVSRRCSPACLLPGGRALPQRRALAGTCFAASGDSGMGFVPSSFVFLHLSCPYSVVGNGNFGYHQHPRYPRRAVCQNPQGECIASLLPVVGVGKARLRGL